jgi:hypothetical protein
MEVLYEYIASISNRNPTPSPIYVSLSTVFQDHFRHIFRRSSCQSVNVDQNVFMFSSTGEVYVVDFIPRGSLFHRSCLRVSRSRAFVLMNEVIYINSEREGTL